MLWYEIASLHNDSGAALEYFYVAKTAACHIYFPNCIKTSAKNLKMLILHWKIILTAVCNPFGFGTFRANCYEWLNKRFIMNMPMFASMHIKIIPKESGWCQNRWPVSMSRKSEGIRRLCIRRRAEIMLDLVLYRVSCQVSALAWPLVVMNRKVYSAEFR